MYTANLKKYKELRRKLRNDMTPAEKILWAAIRRKRLLGYQFKRQYGIENYILDFYCPPLKLAIEVDGDSHYSENAQRYDKMRTRELESWGIKIIRFTNNDVYENLDGVVEVIIRNLDD
jgi:very-short-patch-repair endonuclease